MKKYITLLITLLTLVTFGQNTEKRLNEFIKTEKLFTEKESLNKTLTEKINVIALDFMVISKSKESKEEKYQEKIGHGLCGFAKISTELDSETRKNIYTYLKKLITIIELENSDNKDYIKPIYKITKF